MLAYKRQTAVEAAKREALDRQLDFLVGQTQRYSSLLAAKLKREADDKAAAAAKVGLCTSKRVHWERLWPLHRLP